jgi:hypothetical protein
MVPLSFILLYSLVEQVLEKKQVVFAAVIVILTVLLQGIDFFSNISEGIVSRQFLKQDNYEGKTIQYLKTTIKPSDTLLSIPAAHNQIYYFYFPNNRVIGQLPNDQIMRQKLTRPLPDDVFDYKVQPTFVVFRDDLSIVSKNRQVLLARWPGQYSRVYERLFKINTPFWKSKVRSIKKVEVFKRIS